MISEIVLPRIYYDSFTEIFITFRIVQEER